MVLVYLRSWYILVEDKYIIIKDNKHYITNQEQINKYRSDRYKTDPEFRDRVKRLSKESKNRAKNNPIKMAIIRMNDRKRKKGKLDYILKNRVRLRLRCIELLGNKCVNCGESDEEVLEFDHKNNDGKKDRKSSILALILLNPSRFQLLCANCHKKKTRIWTELMKLFRRGIPPF